MSYKRQHFDYENAALNNRIKANIKQREYYAKNREASLEYQRNYRLKNPDKIRASQRKWAVVNRERKNETHRKWNAKNRDRYKPKWRIYRERWRKNHPEYKKQNAMRESKRRALKANAAVNDLTVKDWETIKAHYNYRCIYCGKKPKTTLEMDHITPLSKGGNHTKSNIVPACRNCNSSKRANEAPIMIQPLML